MLPLNNNRIDNVLTTIIVLMNELNTTNTKELKLEMKEDKSDGERESFSVRVFK